MNSFAQPQPIPQPHEATPGASILHPAVLISLLVLLINDHYLKQAFPSFLTGKLSDFAGLLLFPVVLHATFERLVARRTRQPPPSHLSDRILLLVIIATSLGFALVELWPAAEWAYRVGLGVLQWPFRAVLSAIDGSGFANIAPVKATADVSDLIALPMAWLAWPIARARGADGHGESARRDTGTLRRTGTALLVASTVVLGTDPAFAQPAAQRPNDRHRAGAYTHDGLYAAAELGGGAMLLDSRASVSNGFRQPIPSSARGALFPVFSIALGGTLRDRAIVIGGRLTLAESNEPAIRTLGERFSIDNQRVILTDVAIFSSYYPDRHGGLHFGGALGLTRLAVGEGVEALRANVYPDSEEQTGISLSADAGYSWWISKQWGLGGVGRLFVARTTGERGRTFVFAPVLLGSVAWH